MGKGISQLREQFAQQYVTGWMRISDPLFRTFLDQSEFHNFSHFSNIQNKAIMLQQHRMDFEQANKQLSEQLRNEPYLRSLKYSKSMPIDSESQIKNSRDYLQVIFKKLEKSAVAYENAIKALENDEIFINYCNKIIKNFKENPTTKFILSKYLAKKSTKNNQTNYINCPYFYAFNILNSGTLFEKFNAAIDLLDAAKKGNEVAIFYWKLLFPNYEYTFKKINSSIEIAKLLIDEGVFSEQILDSSIANNIKKLNYRSWYVRWLAAVREFLFATDTKKLEKILKALPAINQQPASVLNQQQLLPGTTPVSSSVIITSALVNNNDGTTDSKSLTPGSGSPVTISASVGEAVGNEVDVDVVASTVNVQANIPTIIITPPPSKETPTKCFLDKQEKNSARKRKNPDTRERSKSDVKRSFSTPVISGKPPISPQFKRDVLTSSNSHENMAKLLAQFSKPFPAAPPSSPLLDRDSVGVFTQNLVVVN